LDLVDLLWSAYHIYLPGEDTEEPGLNDVKDNFSSELLNRFAIYSRCFCKQKRLNFSLTSARTFLWSGRWKVNVILEGGKDDKIN